MTLADHDMNDRRGSSAPRPDQRATGIALAGVTAVISGFAVFVNGYGVQRFDDPTTYTTAKNLVAALLITAVFATSRFLHLGAQPGGPRITTRRERSLVPGVQAGGPHITTRRARFLTLGAIAVIGGSVPFVLFFEGLTRVSSSDAAFIHKTLVAWVAVLAVVVLKERVAWPHLVAIGLILIGYATLAGGVGFPALGAGEVLIFAATLCWSVEVVLARSLLRRGVGPFVVSTSRMLGGAVLLIAWAVARGAVGDLFGLSGEQWRWALLTGVFLSGYVISWHHALARAQAVDVTAMLVIGAAITALLNAGVRDLPLQPVGVVLLAVGGLMIAVAGVRPRPEVRVA